MVRYKNHPEALLNSGVTPNLHKRISSALRATSLCFSIAHERSACEVNFKMTKYEFHSLYFEFGIKSANKTVIASQGSAIMLLLKNADVYAPQPQGVCDILIGGGEILALQPHIDESGLPVQPEVIDADGCLVTPGFIDNHVHIAGGGGEGGFQTRTAELDIQSALRAGVTTVVGVLGTDGVTRSMEELLAKVYALRNAGISAWCYTGSYHVPLQTFTESLMRDIMLIEPIIGAGEIAISDHRSSRPRVAELARLVADARIAGMLSGKAGVVNFHVGDEPAGLDPVFELSEHLGYAKTVVLPTHCGRNKALYQQAKIWASSGGAVDFTTSSVPQFVKNGEISASRALDEFIREGIDVASMTWSSDGQGSLPLFDEKGQFSGLTTGTCQSLITEMKAALAVGIPLETALMPLTTNPARILKLPRKGALIPGFDADLVVFSRGMEPETVIAGGRVLFSPA